MLGKDDERFKPIQKKGPSLDIIQTLFVYTPDKNGILKAVAETSEKDVISKYLTIKGNILKK